MIWRKKRNGARSTRGILNGLNNERMAATRHGLDWRVTGGTVFPDDLFSGRGVCDTVNRDSGGRVE